MGLELRLFDMNADGRSDYLLITTSVPMSAQFHNAFIATSRNITQPKVAGVPTNPAQILRPDFAFQGMP